jgi:hypothetical protein
MKSIQGRIRQVSTHSDRLDSSRLSPTQPQRYLRQLKFSSKAPPVDLSSQRGSRLNTSCPSPARLTSHHETTETLQSRRYDLRPWSRADSIRLSCDEGILFDRGVVSSPQPVDMKVTASLKLPSLKKPRLRRPKRQRLKRLSMNAD